MASGFRCITVTRSQAFCLGSIGLKPWAKNAGLTAYANLSAVALNGPPAQGRGNGMGGRGGVSSA